MPRFVGHPELSTDVLSNCRSVICSSSSVLTKQPLSVYKWPQRRPAVLEWLDQCVQDTVKQLDRAPFVQLMYSERADPLETHHVSRTETGLSDVRSLCTCCAAVLCEVFCTLVIVNPDVSCLVVHS